MDGKLLELIGDDVELRKELDDLIEAAKAEGLEAAPSDEDATKAAYSEGVKAGKAAAGPAKKDDTPKQPDCFGKYPKKPEDVKRKCRICTFAQKCKKKSKVK